MAAIIFTLLTGTPPFHDENPYILRERVAQRDLKWPKKVEISSEARDLILKCTNIYKHLRLDLNQVLRHDFFTKFSKDLPTKLPCESLVGVPTALINRFK